MTDEERQQEDTALITAMSFAAGVPLDMLLQLLHVYEDINPDLPSARMAEEVALQNAGRALLRRIGAWPQNNADKQRCQRLARALLELKR